MANFVKPASHEDPGFLSAKGHGELAAKGNQSCAVCHARDFCTQCHVNAPEVQAIQALAPDPRSLALKAELRGAGLPPGGRFLSPARAKPRRDPARCAFCHTQESCLACHRSRPTVISALPAAGPGRGTGAQHRTEEGRHRTRPISPIGTVRPPVLTTAGCQQLPRPRRVPGMPPPDDGRRAPTTRRAS